MLENISPRAAKAKRWHELIGEQVASSKSIQVFCAEHGINHHTFRYWRAKIFDLKNTGQKNLPSRFIAISRQDFKSAPPRIILPNGVTIDLGIGLDSIFANQFLLTLCGVGLSKGQHAKS